jgi:RHS repeat-associated protein
MSFNQIRVNLFQVSVAPRSIFSRLFEPKIIRRMIRVSVQVFFVSFCLHLSALAQNFQHTEKTADSSLRSNLQVDPSTLGMTLQIPLGEYPGRNGNNISITLSYGSKLWRIETVDGFTLQGAGYHTQSQVRYAEHSISGWTSSLELPEIEYVAQIQPFDGIGSPICFLCTEQPLAAQYFIERLLVHMPGGSTHELRKNETPVSHQNLALTGVYYAVDGSRLKFDANTATLYIPNGSRYLLAAPGGAQFIDRNGNTLTYNSTNKQWTDTLGRIISLPPLQNSAPADLQYLLPGYGATNRVVTFRYRNLSDVRTDPSQPLRYKGDKSCPGYPETAHSPSLFKSTPISEGSASVCQGGPLFNPVVLWQIVLPNNKVYTFTYNIYGEIDKVVLPTGGYQRFRYEEVDSLSVLEAPYRQVNRGVVEHWVSAKGDGTDEVRRQYSAVNDTLKLRTTFIEPTGAKSERLLHIQTPTNIPPDFGFEDARTGRAYEERAYSASGQMIRRTLNEWTRSGPLPGGWGSATRDPRTTKRVEILLDIGGNALARTTMISYDADLNVIGTNSYDHVSINQTTAQTGAIDSIPVGALLRTEESTYLVNDANIPQATRDAYRARNLVALPTQVVVKNGAGNIVALTKFSYDEPAYTPLTYAGGIPGWTDPGTFARGNVTTTQVWNNITGGFIVSHAQPDQCGNIRKTWDAKGNATEFFYDDSFSDEIPRNTFAFATRTESPVPDPSGTYASNTPHVARVSYDFSTGKVVLTSDPNNIKIRNEYDDPLNRLTKTIRAEGTSVQSQTTFAYNDNARRIEETSDLNILNDAKLKSEVIYDRLGRTIETRQYETGSTYTAVKTLYDALGRPSQVSNPHRPGEPVAWTTTEYDALSRVIRVTTPDGSQVNTQYSGNQVMVTDQAGKSRWSETNALGQLTKVIEDPGGLGYETNYEYDALNNLLKVKQGSQERTYAHDSNSRLTSATNPESGTVTYKYDENGNLTEKTDARNITTKYKYDALNRNTEVDYSNTPLLEPDIKRSYDNTNAGSYGIGRLWKEFSGGDMTTGTETDQTVIDSYDPLGRPLVLKRQFKKNGVWSAVFTTSQTYDIPGNVKTLTYPSGHTVDYSYDQAGRLSGFTGNLGGGAVVNYATGIQYNGYGLKSRETYETQTPLYLNLHYNNRLQMTDLRLGDNSNDQWNMSRGGLLFYYDRVAIGMGDPSWPNSQANNGNLLQQVHYVPQAGGGAVAHADDYAYDPLNRVTSVVEQSQSQNDPLRPVFNQQFSYDRFGNRKIEPVGTGTVSDDVVWVDDSLPAGATTGADGGDSWTWVPAMSPYSGNFFFQSSTFSGLHQLAVVHATQTLQINAGDKLFAYIYLDAAKMPSEVMLQWSENDSWEHRAYWGTNGSNLIPFGTNGTTSRWYMGPLPAAGGWVRLEVPASQVGLEGKTVNGMAFTLYGGAASWDKLGKASSSGETVWVDDGLPEGAVIGTFQNRWSWIPAMSPYSGAVSVQSSVASGFHQVYFTGATQTMQVNEGDYLYAYVYLGPAYTSEDEVPSEVMLQWYENGSWEHRAYWGANTIQAGTDGTASRRYMGPLPHTNRWMRLEVPASAVGLEGKTVSGLGFTLYGGRASWDKAGKGRLGNNNTVINERVLAFNTANNRLTSMDGLAMSYDNAGNQINDGSGERIYDAENRLVEAKNGAVVVGQYAYDAGRKRTRRIGGGQETWYVYGIGGELLAEYNANAAVGSPQKEYGYRNGQLLVVWDGSETVDRRLQWLVQDHLGSTRMVVDRSGGLGGIRRHDYLPFGEELGSGVGIRSASIGYGDDSVRQKFTGYERDDETGLDFAQARYYSNIQGRFTSPDPLLASGIEEEPQSWNRYTYCLNHPLKFTDTTGLIWGFLQSNAGDRYVWYNSKEELDAAGATVITANALGNGDAFVYQAANGAFIRLDLSRNSWQGFETEGEAQIDRTMAEDGSSALGDLGNTFNLFTGAHGVAGLSASLGRAAFLRATTTQVFRVEALAGTNTRLLINETGQVTVQGENMLFLNFGVESRAGDFLAKRLAQGFEDSVIKSFRVQKSFLKELQSSAVLEGGASLFPWRPLLVDVKVANQFGLRYAQIEKLQKAIVQGSGRIKF